MLGSPPAYVAKRPGSPPTYTARDVASRAVTRGQCVEPLGMIPN
jgi:hypothetical protein